MTHRKKECKLKDLCLKTCLWENGLDCVIFTKDIWQRGHSCHLILSPERQVHLDKPKQGCSCKVPPLRPRWQTKRQLLTNLEALGQQLGLPLPMLSLQSLWNCAETFTVTHTVSVERVGPSASATVYGVGTHGLYTLTSANNINQDLSVTYRDH